MDHHNHAGFHISLSGNAIKPQHYGFDQIGFYLLGPCDFEAALQSLTGKCFESPDSSQGTTHYTIILGQSLELLSFPFEKGSHGGITAMKVVNIFLRSVFVDRCLLFLSLKSAIPLEDL